MYILVQELYWYHVYLHCELKSCLLLLIVSLNVDYFRYWKHFYAASQKCLHSCIIHRWNDTWLNYHLWPLASSLLNYCWFHQEWISSLPEKQCRCNKFGERLHLMYSLQCQNPPPLELSRDFIFYQDTPPFWNKGWRRRDSKAHLNYIFSMVPTGRWGHAGKIH